MAQDNIKEADVSEIHLEEGKINYNGEWLSTDDLTGKIQASIGEGDLNIASLAAALEELVAALENSRALEIRIVLPREDYDTLKARGGEDDRECIRKAILAFISGEERPDTVTITTPAKKEQKGVMIKCAKCNTPFEVSSEERPIEIECPFCGTGRVLES